MYDLIFEQKGKDERYKIWHTPENNIFLFVRSGDGSIVLREKSYPLTSGVLCFIGKNKYHYTFPQKPDQYVRSKLLLDSASLSKITQALNAPSEFSDMFSEDAITISILSGLELDSAAKIFCDLSRISHDSKYAEAETYSAALQLMIILAKNVSAKTQKAPDAMQRVIGYINRHISEELSIEQISDACYISKYYLCRSFKKRFGLTIMEYILQTRISMAKELLEKQKASVTQISILCGFSSPSYFSRVFKETVGVSPLKYKKDR